jgi:hypothetical protein
MVEDSLKRCGRLDTRLRGSEKLRNQRKASSRSFMRRPVPARFFCFRQAGSVRFLCQPLEGFIQELYEKLDGRSRSHSLSALTELPPGEPLRKTRHLGTTSRASLTSPIPLMALIIYIVVRYNSTSGRFLSRREQRKTQTESSVDVVNRGC